MEKSSDAALVGPLCHSGSTCNGCGFDRYVVLPAVSIQAKLLEIEIGVDFLGGHFDWFFLGGWVQFWTCFK